MGRKSIPISLNATLHCIKGQAHQKSSEITAFSNI